MKIFLSNKNKYLIVFFIVFAFQESFSLKEKDLFNAKDKLIEWRKLKSKSKYIISADNKKIFYRLYPGVNDKKNNNLLFVLPGMTEPEIKYTELIYDIKLKFFGTIVVVDHRGQGQSDRDIDDLQKTFIYNFNSYISDLKKIINIEKKLYSNLFIIGHSMGAHIAYKYLIENSDLISKAVLVSPMFEINLGMPWFVLDAYKFFLRPELSDYLPGRGPFKNNISEKDKLESSVTSSLSRINLERFYLKNDAKIQKGGVTLGWLLEAKKSNEELRSNKKIINSSLVILQASEDRMVKNEVQNKICKAQPNCQIRQIKGAKHEILMEKDFYRDKAINEIYDFFNI